MSTCPLFSPQPFPRRYHPHSNRSPRVLVMVRPPGNSGKIAGRYRGRQCGGKGGGGGAGRRTSFQEHVRVGRCRRKAPRQTTGGKGEDGGTGRRTSFQEHVRVGRCSPMVDPHAGGSAQRASEGRALSLRLIDHTAVPGRRLGASAGVALPRPRR